MAGIISPAALGATTYAITTSRRAIVDLEFDFFLGSTNTFTVAYPTAAAGVQVTLRRGVTTLNLLPGPLTNDLTFGTRSVTTSSAAAGANTELTCTLSTVTTEAMGEVWSVRLSATAATTWGFTQLENSAVDLTVTRLLADPVAQLTGVVPAAPKEHDVVMLTAAPAIAAGTVVAAVAPAVFYRWSYTGTIAIAGFPVSGASQTHSFTAPSVYADQTVQLSLEVWLEGDAVTPGFVTASATQPLTLASRPQHLLLVLDRSGSMGGSRWANATAAARMMAQMYIALRARPGSTDRVGILTFTDQRCDWKGFWSPDNTGLTLPMALTQVGAGEGLGALCTTSLGNVDACTNIGDALIKAMWHLHPYASEAAQPWFHVVLLTDGYENSGSVYLAPDPDATAAGARTFSSASMMTVDGRLLSQVKSRLSLYPIGLGATVDDEVLNQLSWGTTGMPTTYRNVTALSQIKEAFADAVGTAHDAQQVVSAASPAALQALLMGVTVPADPGAPAARYLAVEPGANRLLIAVEWAAGANTLELARAPAGGSYTPLTVAVTACTQHGFVSVDLASLYGGATSVPQTFWRVVHKVSGTATAIPDDKFFAYVDLNVRVDLVLDKNEYRTGDPMVVTAKLREGPRAITGAKVTVELARPGHSLGTFLSGGASQPGPTTGDRLTPTHVGTHGTATTGGTGDAPPPKQALLQRQLALHQLESLTIQAPSVFPDGTARLFDDGAHHDGAAGDGDYANVYTQVDQEGTYTWRIFATGRLSDGTAFTRLVTRTTWVGIRPDFAVSPIQFLHLDTAPAGWLAVQVSVVPKTTGGELLGPFRAGVVKLQTTAGSFQGSVVGTLAGEYRQVLHYRPGEQPQVTVTVGDATSRPVPVHRNPVGCAGLLARLLRWVRGLFGP